MKIYVSHSKGFDFQNELYKPLKEAGLLVEFIFPHEQSDQLYETKLLLVRHECDLVLAEVSIPSVGQGIELGWADAYKMPIIAFYKKGTEPARSLSVVTKRIIEYSDNQDLVSKITSELGLNIA